MLLRRAEVGIQLLLLYSSLVNPEGKQESPILFPGVFHARDLSPQLQKTSFMDFD